MSSSCSMSISGPRLLHWHSRAWLCSEPPIDYFKAAVIYIGRSGAGISCGWCLDQTIGTGIPTNSVYRKMPHSVLPLLSPALSLSFCWRTLVYLILFSQGVSLVCPQTLWSLGVSWRENRRPFNNGMYSDKPGESSGKLLSVGMLTISSSNLTNA